MRSLVHAQVSLTAKHDHVTTEMSTLDFQLSDGLLRVFFVSDVLTPIRARAVLVGFDDGEVGHEIVGCGTVPMVFAWIEKDTIAGTDLLDRATATLSPADAFRHEQALPMGMGVPGGAGSWCEMHVVGADT